MKRVRAPNVRVLTTAGGVSPAFASRFGIELWQGRRAAASGSAQRADATNLGIMSSEKAIELEGTITTVLPGTMFRVALANDHLVLAHISGKMRKRFIRLTIGDRVKMEMSPYDTARARIVYRL